MKKHKCIIEKKQLMGKNYHLFLFQQRIEIKFNKGIQIGYKCAREKGIASSIHSLWVPSIPTTFFRTIPHPRVVPCYSVAKK